MSVDEVLSGLELRLYLTRPEPTVDEFDEKTWRRLLEKLHPHDRHILYLWLAVGLSQAEMAAEIGTSRTRAFQYVGRICRRLRGPLAALEGWRRRFGHLTELAEVFRSVEAVKAKRGGK